MSAVFRLQDFISYVEPTPEEIAQRQAEIKALVQEQEAIAQKREAQWACRDAMNERVGGRYRALSDDKESSASVEYGTFSYPDRLTIHIEGKFGTEFEDSADLDLKEALALLKWLEQEREMIEQLAKEHEA